MERPQQRRRRGATGAVAGYLTKRSSHAVCCVLAGRGGRWQGWGRVVARARVAAGAWPCAEDCGVSCMVGLCEFVVSGTTPSRRGEPTCCGGRGECVCVSGVRRASAARPRMRRGDGGPHACRISAHACTVRRPSLWRPFALRW